MPHMLAAPVGALATSRANSLGSWADIDDATLVAFVAEVERQRRRDQKWLAIGLALPYIPCIFIPHPIVIIGSTLFATLSVVGTVGFSRLLRKAFHGDAEQYGLTPELSRELRQRAWRVSGYVPRWVRGPERARAIADRLRQDLGG